MVMMKMKMMMIVIITMMVVMIMGLMITFHQVNVGLGLPPCASQTNSLDLKVFLDNQIRYHQHHQHHHEYHVHLMRSNIFSSAEYFSKTFPQTWVVQLPVSEPGGKDGYVEIKVY